MGCDCFSGMFSREKVKEVELNISDQLTLEDRKLDYQTKSQYACSYLSCFLKFALEWYGTTNMRGN